MARGSLRRNKGVRPRRQDLHRVQEGTAVEMEVVEAQIRMGEGVDYKDALPYPRISVSPIKGGGSPYHIPYETPVESIDFVER